MQAQDVILEELITMFHDIQPDQSYLSSDTSLCEEIHRIETQIHRAEEPIHKKINSLVTFNSEWFPDELEQEEQDYYQSILDQASNISP